MELARKWKTATRFRVTVCSIRGHVRVITSLRIFERDRIHHVRLSVFQKARFAELASKS